MSFRLFVKSNPYPVIVIDPVPLTVAVWESSLMLMLSASASYVKAQLF